MSQMKIKHKAEQVVREAARNRKISETADVLYAVPELMDAVEIDTERLQEKAWEELNRKTVNPINALLRLMNLRIINTRKTAEVLLLEDGEEVRTDSMLRLNTSKLDQAAKKLTGTLEDIEKRQREERRQSREQSSTVFTELDRKTRECAQLQADMKGQQEAVMDHAQYMLSLMGKEDDSPVARQLVEMLEDIGIAVWWEAADVPFTESAMFTEIVCDDPENRRGKPCLTNEAGVALKGVRFVRKQA